MPRTYVRKTVGYHKAFLLSALQDIAMGKSIRAASVQYGVPFQTLCRWAHKPPTRMGSGRGTLLTQDEEHCIVIALKFLYDCGFTFNRQDLINIAQDYMALNCKPGPPKLGIEWARNFEKRWNNHLPKMKSKILTQSREATLCADVVNSFSTTYINLLDKNGLSNHPNRIFNLDEAGLSTNIDTNKVLISKRSRNFHTTSSVYAVLFCISADGSYMPPFTIYKSARLNPSWTKCGPPGTLYGCSASGWMDDKIFESWMEHFVSYTKNTQKPIFLIFHSRGCRLTYKTVKTAMDNQVILFCLPPNSSHVLQPLDVGVFGPAEKTWRQILGLWYQETGLSDVSGASFLKVLKIFFESLRKDHAVNGFRSAGFFPPNISEVEHKIVITPRASNKSDVSSTYSNIDVSLKCESEVEVPPNFFKTDTLLESSPGTSDANVERPSGSTKHGNAIQNPTNLLSSPLHYISAVLT